MKPASWPRYMVEKRTRAGLAYYWRPPGRDVAKECPVHAEALGDDYAGAVARAQLLNEHLDAWRNGLGEPKSIDLGARFGTIDWWVETYLRSDAYTNLSARSRADYQEALEKLADLETNLTDARTGARKPRWRVACRILITRSGRQAVLNAAGWRRRSPSELPDRCRSACVEGGRSQVSGAVPDPKSAQSARDGFRSIPLSVSSGSGAKERRSQRVGSRRMPLPNRSPDIGHPALGAAALICYEWLQRPENVLAGKISWPDYRPSHHPLAVRIDHHKTKKKIWQPLEDEQGRLYPEIEAFLTRVPRLGIPIVLFEPERGPKSAASGKEHPVSTAWSTLDTSCRRPAPWQVSRSM